MKGVKFLDGLRVLELGDAVAGAGATSLLAALGAEVTSLVDPKSAHRRGRPAASPGQPSLLSVVLDRRKKLLPAPEYDLHAVAALIDGEDFGLVVVDRVAGLTGPLAPLQPLESYLSFVNRANSGAWLSISAFGLSGDRREDTAGEMTIAAASGMLASVHDPATGAPMKLAGCQSLLNTSQVAALAACHALDLASDGAPVHIDLSALEATIATGPILEASTILLTAGGPGGAKRYGAPASFYTCRDGQIRISAMEDHQWNGVVVAMGSPEWTDRFATTQSRIDGQDEIDARISEWTATLGKIDAETLLQAHGVPATAMYSPAEILSSPQLAHRGSFETIDVDGRPATIVGSPYRSLGESGEVRSRSIRGLRVAEVSHVLAVPLAGAILAALGAEVIKLEDLQRIDMYRRRGPYIDNRPGVERSSYFALVNHSKSSQAFDFEYQPDRLAAVLDRSDVVIENVGGKRAARLGIAASEVLRKRPGVLAVSSSGFGQDGPFSSYRAYAYNLQASCCLGYLTRSEDGEPAEIDLPWADVVSGFAVAAVIAAWAVGPSGNRGAGLDFAMADLVIGHFNEFIAAASLDPSSDGTVDRANEMAPFAPNGVYPTEDGWIAISVLDDAAFGALRDTLRVPAPAPAPDRFAQRKELDALVAAATSTCKAAELARDLRALGIDAEEVVTARQLPDVKQLVDRDFFTSVEHPEWGRKRLIGIPWRPYGRPAIPLGPPPLLVES